MQNKINYKLLTFLLLLNQPFTYAVNQKFADIPLNLQNESTVTISSDARIPFKPNVTFFINNTGGMGVINITAGTGPKSKDVANALYYIRDNYWHDFNFSVKPLNGYINGRDGSYHSWFNGFVTGSKDTHENKHNLTQLNAAISSIGNQYTGYGFDYGSFPSRLQAIARNTVMNKLQYRCQKSYLIILAPAATSARKWYLPESDAKRYVRDDNRALDGYFDGVIRWTQKEGATGYRNDTYLKREDGSHLMQYYTDTLRTKSFGNFIYERDIVGEQGDWFIQLKQKPVQFQRKVDKAGLPWNGPDPLAHLPGHSPTYTQTATTFTIGFNIFDYNPAAPSTQLKLAASPRPDYDPVTNPNSRYAYFPNTAQELVKAFDDIAQEIKRLQKSEARQNEEVVVTGPALGEARAETNIKLQNLLVKNRIETANWSSQLCFHNLNESAEDLKSCHKQPSFNNRQLVLNDGQNSYLYTNTLQGLNNQTFKIPNNRDLNQNEWLDGLLNWFSRHSNQNIKQENFVLDYRQRNDKANHGSTRNMGDIINNPIETIGDNEFNKQKYLITSANDGMVYVFRATNNDNNPYDLKFNYMPMAIERDSTDGSDLVSHYYKDLTSNNYGKDPAHPHRYLLNGGFTVVQTPALPNKPKQIFMVSNMGQAGRGAFAINVGGKDLVTGLPIAAENINNAGWYKDLFLFQTPTGADNHLGYTIGTPKIAITRVNRDKNASNTSYNDHLREATFINNGFNYPGIDSDNNESALYIYDVLGVDVGNTTFQRIDDAKGTLIRKLTAPDGKGGLATPTIYDINDDGVADLVYAGDYHGNLYRFDIRDPNPSKWKVKKIFTATGPITAPPALFKPDYDANDPRTDHKVIVVFGTGSDIYQNDLTKKDQQAIYGIYDDHDDDSSTVINKGQLLQQTMTYSADGKFGQLSNKPFSSSQYKGWYFNLHTDGERVVTSFDQLLTTGIIITRAYNVNVNITKETTTSDGKPVHISGIIGDGAPVVSNGKHGFKKYDPCVDYKTTAATTATESLSRLTQFDARTGGALGSNSPRIKLKNEDNFYNSVRMSGLIGLKISTDIQYNNFKAGVSGNQKIPGSAPTAKHCLHELPHGSLSNDQAIDFENIPLCGINFKRLSWQEIKTGYFD